MTQSNVPLGGRAAPAVCERPATAIIPCPSCKTRFKCPSARLNSATVFQCSHCGANFQTGSGIVPASPAIGGTAPPVARGAKLGASSHPGPQVTEDRSAPPVDAVRAQPSALREKAIAPVFSAPAQTRSRLRGFLRRNAVLLAVLTLLVAVSLIGLPYYLLPAGARLRSEFHPWLKPSGYIGQSAGILAFALFVFLWLYPLRKKFRALAFTGALNRWLDVHIFAGIVIPLLGAIHASWDFDGLIGIGYFAMVVVSLSGMVGKYLYLHIPRSRSGLELSLSEAQERQQALVLHLAKTLAISPDAVKSAMDSAAITPSGRSLPRAVLGLISSDIARWKVARTLRRQWRKECRLDKASVNEAVRLARRQMALAQQVRMLNITNRLFRYWHVAHRPVSITAMVVIVIHVAVVVSLGVTWLW